MGNPYSRSKKIFFAGQENGLGKPEFHSHGPKKSPPRSATTSKGPSSPYQFHFSVYGVDWGGGCNFTSLSKIGLQENG